MRPLKSGEQKNVILSNEMYTESELKQIKHCTNDVFTLENDYDEKGRQIYRLSLSDVSDLRVMYNSEYGFYEVMAIMNNTNRYHVTM